jgi:hypothetical protein
MQRITVRIVAIVALILAALLILTRRTRDRANEQTSPRGSDSASTSTAPRPESKARPARTSPDSHRDSPQLIALKKRWLALKELDPNQATEESYTERNKLSEESARTLLCSEDAIELILFLREKNIDNVVESRIEKLFKSDLAADARQSLVDLLNKPSADGTNYRMHFSRLAGEGCPPDEFQAFSAALADPICSQEAFFGQQVALAKTDPTGALKATIAEVEKGTRSNTSSDSINRLISALPPQTDFAEIDSLLPHTEPTGPELSSTYAYMSSGLVNQWSKSDPSAAAHHIMEHPDRYPVSKIETPVMEILSKDLATGIEWIQELPEGPYFDQAASVAITRLMDARKPQEAHLLASQIGDPELRRALMKAALGPPPRYEEDNDRK